ncbi:hypothetical protein [Nitratireductor sp. XY-223]|uniref:hypothetical protein n=1 Tax=Nitratireductor sp. XY-223 TaxID=2561926 RepID=UPI0010AA737C|nr:hypothetical protein [Nitratireductor sp. XY-223]
MKLIIRQYLQNMKERGELDILLPLLLSELGYEVIHRPQSGSRQAGVDVAAVGPDPDGDEERSLLLFVIKPGNIGRVDWCGSPQAVRSTLADILDDYVPHRVPEQYRDLPIAICVCTGGEIQETVRQNWRGFVEQHSKDRLHFREWNGDRLANLILKGIFSPELLDAAHRSHFQKAVVLVSEPEDSYRSFRELLDGLTENIEADRKGTMRLHQMLTCLWILVSNGFDAGNLDAPYRACELAMLHAWDALQRCPKRSKARLAERQEIFNHVLGLYLVVGYKLVFEKIGPHTENQYALSNAVQSSSAIDVNLALFEMLGRALLLGHWHHYFGIQKEGETRTENMRKRDQFFDLAISMINTNPTLFSPMRDDHHIEIGILMLLAEDSGRLPDGKKYVREIAKWMPNRYIRRSYWPTWFRDYRKLARHPVDQGENYFKDSTLVSVLVPFLLLGLERLGASAELGELEKVLFRHLSHMTMQVWVPCERTGDTIWRSGEMKGIGIPVGAARYSENNISLSTEISEIVSEYSQLDKTEAFERGSVPIFLTACRHHRIPLPPHLWLNRQS